MGQTLSEPVVEKHTQTGEDDTLIYGVSEMQGWRISMEDAHATILSLDPSLKGDEKASFFAVYDGHGGSTVAKYSGETVHQRLAKTDEFQRGQYEAALKRAFLGTDEDLKSNKEFAFDPSGCTAVAALLVAGPPSQGQETAKPNVPRRIIVANAGDSRSILSYRGEAKPMSFDHKPQNKNELSRINMAGGFVEFGRVNGNLALSRAIGDFEFKQNYSLPPEEQIVTADPEIISHDVDGEEEFLVLACDGIWDCLSSQEVADFVRRRIAEGKELKDICEEAMDRCLAHDPDVGGVGCDNMTICVVALLGGRSKEDWYSWVKDRVEKKIGWDTPLEPADPLNTLNRSNQGGAGSSGGGLSMGRLGAMGGGSVLSALAGGLNAGDDDDERPGSLRLPGGLAGALGGAGIVFRPGNQTDDDGDVIYEAHVVNSDSDESEESNNAPSSKDAAKIEELSEAGSEEAEKRSQQGQEGRPDLTHQPEIVESPQEGAAAASSAGSKTAAAAGQASAANVEVRSSTEGTVQEDKDASST
ncbi:pp2c-domain-containing protein [Ceraceosorus bombacis]|uniref:protein-serine/threonine phosphatase n=1 Tax=Ceraceosorus bombacis TaxID=401625 RepID=A0A0N7LAK1_9BASI|nr:pp2c-domain-containing protein [Ceraceosorus bombacis]